MKKIMELMIDYLSGSTFADTIILLFFEFFILAIGAKKCFCKKRSREKNRCNLNNKNYCTSNTDTDFLKIKQWDNFFRLIYVLILCTTGTALLILVIKTL